MSGLKSLLGAANDNATKAGPTQEQKAHWGKVDALIHSDLSRVKDLRKAVDSCKDKPDTTLTMSVSLERLQALKAALDAAGRINTLLYDQNQMAAYGRDPAGDQKYADSERQRLLGLMESAKSAWKASPFGAVSIQASTSKLRDKVAAKIASYKK